MAISVISRCVTDATDLWRSCVESATSRPECPCGVIRRSRCLFIGLRLGVASGGMPRVANHPVCKWLSVAFDGGERFGCPAAITSRVSPHRLNTTALTVRTAAQAAGAHVAYLRTRNGDHEVDFIVEGDNGIVAFEVKLSGSVANDDVKHLAWLRERLSGDLVDAGVMTTGPTACSRKDGIAVVPLALLDA